MKEELDPVTNRKEEQNLNTQFQFATKKSCKAVKMKMSSP